MQYYLQNCILLLLPVMIWNIVLYNRLPDFYKPAKWDCIPKYLDISENIFRYIVFFTSALFPLSISAVKQRIGLGIYIIGLVIYFSSWLLQVYLKQKNTQSYVFRGGPAYTTILWLIGIWLMCTNSYIRVNSIRSIYLFFIFTFVCLHSYHAFVVHKKCNG
jgi:hypothetical protein